MAPRMASGFILERISRCIVKSTAQSAANFTVSVAAIALLASCVGESPSTSYAPDVADGSPAATAEAIGEPPTPVLQSPLASPSASRPNTGPAEVSQDLPITPRQMGPIKAGMTLGQIKQKLGDKAQYKTIENWMVDFSGIEVSYDDELQFYLMYYTGNPVSDSYEIPLVWVENPRFQTAEGVGPGSSLGQAIAAYGTATLSYNTDDEMREYVNFERGPDNLLFRSGPTAAGEMFVGIYGETPNAEDPSYFETQQYQDDATIKAVIVPLERVISP